MYMTENSPLLLVKHKTMRVAKNVVTKKLTLKYIIMTCLNGGLHGFSQHAVTWL